MTADKNDGMFHMSINDFRKRFANTSVNINNEKMQFDYFM